MDISIIDKTTGNMRDYTPVQLRKLAHEVAKEHGKLSAHWVTFDPAVGRAFLNAQYLQSDGWSSSVQYPL